MLSSKQADLSSTHSNHNIGIVVCRRKESVKAPTSTVGCLKMSLNAGGMPLLGCEHR